LYLYFSGNKNQFYYIYTFSDESYLRSTACYHRNVKNNIFSFSLTPEKEPITCLSITYILTTANERKYELIITDQLFNTKIISAELEKGVGTIIIIFYTMATSTLMKTIMNSKIYYTFRTM
jgi:hypothetical protein